MAVTSLKLKTSALLKRWLIATSLIILSHTLIFIGPSSAQGRVACVLNAPNHELPTALGDAYLVPLGSGAVLMAPQWAYRFTSVEKPLERLFETWVGNSTVRSSVQQNFPFRKIGDGALLSGRRGLVWLESLEKSPALPLLKGSNEGFVANDITVLENGALIFEASRSLAASRNLGRYAFWRRGSNELLLLTPQMQQALRLVRVGAGAVGYTNNGLVRLRDVSLGFEFPPAATTEKIGSVTKVVPFGEGALIETSKGLYALRDLTSDPAEVLKISPSDGWLRVVGKHAVIVWPGINLRVLSGFGQPVEYGPHPEGTQLMGDEHMFFVSKRELVRFDPRDGTFTRSDNKFELERDFAITRWGLLGSNAKLIDAPDKTIYAFKSATGKFEPLGKGGVFITVGDGIVVESGGELFWTPSPDEKVTRLIGSRGSGAPVHAIETSKHTLLVTVREFFIVRSAPLSELKATIRPVLAPIAFRPTVVEAEVKHPCAKHLLEFKPRLEVLYADTRAPVSPPVEFRSSAVGGDSNTISIQFQTSLPPGEYEFRLLLNNTEGQATAVANSEKFTYRQLSTNEGTDWLSLIGYGLIGHVLVFSAIFLIAGYWGQASELLTSKLWGRAGVWCWLVIYLVPRAQTWILKPYFAESRRRTKEQPYEPVVLTSSVGETAESDIFWRKLTTKRRLWLQGSAGMGKTSLVRKSHQDYFGDKSVKGVFAAYKRHDFIPVVISAGEFRGIGEKEWPLEAASRVLEAVCFPIDDQTLLRSMIRRGVLALVIDGMNEAPKMKEVTDFLQKHSRARVLITSQAFPDSTLSLETWRLPSTLQSVAAQILKILLQDVRRRDANRDANGTRLEWHEEVFRAIPDALRTTIVSGYDIRLIADLNRDATKPIRVPADRISLYSEALKLVPGLFDGSYPLQDLAKFTWGIWVRGVRRFGAADLPPGLIVLLEAETARIVRSVEGNQFEFRHDLMRAYLAAWWLASLVPEGKNPGRTSAVIDALAREDIWTRRVGDALTDSVDVWRFFAALLARRVNKDGSIGDFQASQEIWDFAADDTSRVLLQAAFDDERALREWEFVRRKKAAARPRKKKPQK